MEWLLGIIIYIIFLIIVILFLKGANQKWYILITTLKY
jgi:hypothetical protein